MTAQDHAVILLATLDKNATEMGMAAESGINTRQSVIRGLHTTWPLKWEEGWNGLASISGFVPVANQRYWNLNPRNVDLDVRLFQACGFCIPPPVMHPASQRSGGHLHCCGAR